jgi:hypothetical protein
MIALRETLVFRQFNFARRIAGAFREERVEVKGYILPGKAGEGQYFGLNGLVSDGNLLDLDRLGGICLVGRARLSTGNSARSSGAEKSTWSPTIPRISF